MIATFRPADFSGTYREAFEGTRVTVTPHPDRSYRWIITLANGKTQEVCGTDMGLLISSRLLEKETTS